MAGPSRGKRTVLIAGVAALAALLVAGVVRAALALVTRKSYTIQSPSMAPTLTVGDRLLCAKDVPKRLPRGAVVAYAGGNAVHVKRVVGLPGESVTADGGVVSVDGTPLSEPYADTTGDRATTGPVRVPEGSYFLVGDNRRVSADSRTHGPVAHDAIRAVCTEIVAPRDRRGRIAGT